MRYKNPKQDRYFEFNPEPLESRQMLAGNVSVVARHGDVIINGDLSGNEIQVYSLTDRVIVRASVEWNLASRILNSSELRSIASPRWQCENGSNCYLGK